jgi:hypothetical protein
MSENMNNPVRGQQLRFLFDKGVSGFRFSPPFTTTLTEAKLRTWFGGHNPNAFFFRDAPDRYGGIRLDCQYESCLIHQGIFVAESRVPILANSAGAWSVTLTDPSHAECERRDETLLEENLKKQKAKERAEAGAQKEQQRQERRRRELIEMCFAEQRAGLMPNIFGEYAGDGD